MPQIELLDDVSFMCREEFFPWSSVEIKSHGCNSNSYRFDLGVRPETSVNHPKSKGMSPV